MSIQSKTEDVYAEERFDKEAFMREMGFGVEPPEEGSGAEAATVEVDPCAIAEVLRMEPGAMWEAASGASQPAQERPSLGNIIQHAREEASERAKQDAHAPANRLVGINRGAVLAIEALIGRMVPASGHYGGDGLISPAQLFFDAKAEGKFDELSTAEYEAALDACCEFVDLWEGARTKPSTTLACNALLLTVLREPVVSETAVRYTEKWLLDLHERIKPCIN